MVTKYELLDAPNPQQADLADMKMGGFIKLRESNYYALRLRIPAGNLNAEVMPVLQEVADKYGRGYVSLTTRLGIEIPWVKFEDLKEAQDRLLEAGIKLAGCGPRVRSIVSCKGTVCPYGMFDTQKLALQLDHQFFGPRTFPHKFKIGIAGCPNSCSKPQYNDFGIMGQIRPLLVEQDCNGCNVCVINCKPDAIELRDGIANRLEELCLNCGDCVRSCPTNAWATGEVGAAITIGGKFGKFPNPGHRVAEMFPLDRVSDLITATMDFYCDEGRKGERVLETVERVGLDEYITEIVKPLLQEGVVSDAS